MNNKPSTDREALTYVLGQFDAEIFVCERCSHEMPTKDMDSADFLRRHLAEVPAHHAVTVPQFKFATLVEHCKRLEAQLDAERRRNNDLEFYRDDNAVWHWQNDGQDFLESLSCPVIIPAYQLRDLLKPTPQPQRTMEMFKAAEKAGVSFATQEKCFNAWFGGLPAPADADEVERLGDQVSTLIDALKAIEPWIPTTSAVEGGAARYSANVLAADKVRAALASVAPEGQKLCVECDQPYCHGVCVEKGDKDHD